MAEDGASTRESVGDGGDSGLPEYVPPSDAKPSLMDEILNMSSKGKDTMNEIDAKGKEIAKVEKRVRRKSRDLEELVFGMQITDVELLKKVFDELDVTKDGYIDRAELKPALEKANKTISEERADEIFKSLDKDGNNLLDFKEFQQAFLAADK